MMKEINKQLAEANKQLELIQEKARKVKDYGEITNELELIEIVNRMHKLEEMNEQSL